MLATTGGKGVLCLLCVRVCLCKTLWKVIGIYQKCICSCSKAQSSLWSMDYRFYWMDSDFIASTSVTVGRVLNSELQYPFHFFRGLLRGLDETAYKVISTVPGS